MIVQRDLIPVATLAERASCIKEKFGLEVWNIVGRRPHHVLPGGALHRLGDKPPTEPSALGTGAPRPPLDGEGTAPRGGASTLSSTVHRQGSGAGGVSASRRKPGRECEPA